MKFQYHNTLWVFLSVALLIFLFSALDINDNRFDEYAEKSNNTGPKNGSITSNHANGKTRTKINYLNGEKHGKSYMYYDDGTTVQLEMTYVHGLRSGVSKKYFKTGELYAETPYENDVLNGIRKVYYKNGSIKAEIPYSNGYPGLGTQEFLLSGKIKATPIITYHQEGVLIYLDTSIPCKEPEFYIGKLIDDKYFNVLDENIQLLHVDGTDFYIDIDIYTPSYLKYQDIMCKCETTQGHPLILKTRINTSSLKKVN